jgi:hypothetical protein
MRVPVLRTLPIGDEDVNVIDTFDGWCRRQQRLDEFIHDRLRS